MSGVEILVFDQRHKNLESGKLWFHACVGGGGVVGIASLTDLDKPFAWMNDLFVVPHWRRKGIGRKLVQARIEFARPLEFRGLNAAFAPEAIESIALAESLGFRRVYDYPAGTQLFALLF